MHRGQSGITCPTKDNGGSAVATLGKLERVDLRQIWETEAQHFTPWLAQEENLQILADTTGIELGLEAQEKNVGPFRADILCKDSASGNWVLIENQLQRTDHLHRGRLIKSIGNRTGHKMKIVVTGGSGMLGQHVHVWEKYLPVEAPAGS